MLVKNVDKCKNKIVTSDVDITVVLVVKVKIKKGSVQIFQKRWQVNIFKQRIFVLYFLAHLGWTLKFARVGRWSEMS